MAASYTLLTDGRRDERPRGLLLAPLRPAQSHLAPISTLKSESMGRAIGFTSKKRGDSRSARPSEAPQSPLRGSRSSTCTVGSGVRKALLLNNNLTTGSRNDGQF
jgi:hypothetical protein